jgi:hypothetical protein
MENQDRQEGPIEPRQLSFLPPLELAATWPKPTTQPGIALKRLLKGERLTQPSYGLACWRLAAYIKELEYLGWPISSANVPCPPGLGTGRRIREYWLPQWVLAVLIEKELAA